VSSHFPLSISSDDVAESKVTGVSVVPYFRRLFAGLSPQRSGFAPESVHVGFVVDKVALGQVILRVFGFPMSISFHCNSPYLRITWGRTIGPLVAAFQRQSHPIYMNNNNKQSEYRCVIKELSSVCFGTKALDRYGPLASCSAFKSGNKIPRFL
jgi:hypothetical protein